MKLVFKILLAIFFVTPIISFSQSAPISIDGRFDDWDSSLSTFTDIPESIGGIDILEFQVTNDDQFLFVKVTLDTEIDLTEDLIPHDLYLYIDTDNNASTGFGVQAGFGSELGVRFKHLNAYYDVTPSSTVNFTDIQFRLGPTVSGNEFELAIGRDVIPDGINPLFPSATIKLMFKEWNDGDVAPNSGNVFSYTFDETPIPALEPTEIDKEDPSLLRILAYNTWANGLINSSRLPYFERIIPILDAEIMGFSESGNTSASDVKLLLDQWMPLGTVDGWYTIKSGDLITASKWPFLDSWTLDGQFPVLIDLPSSYGSDLLFVNCHLDCCGGNDGRQDQVDAFAEFMLDAKSPGGVINLAENTPMVYAGDLNLVGYAQQLITLVTGDIVQTDQFGPGGSLDWDDTDLTDQICRQTDKRMAYTWRKDSGGDFPPGRLDFMIHTDAVIEAVKSFTLQTEIMPTERLNLYGLQQNDTQNASDHFPVVVDYNMFGLSDVDEDGILDEFDNCIDTPNTDQADWNDNGTGDACEDSDGDDLLDIDEIIVYNTDPDDSDTDNDGLDDGVEVIDSGTEPLIQDTDGDGLTDGLEWGTGGEYDPNNPDTNDNGCGDAMEFSYQCGDDPCTDCIGDLDNDSIINISDLLIMLSVFGNICE